MSDHAPAAAASAQEVEREVRRLLNEAKRTRGGGSSLENLLDAQFLAQAASLLQQSEMISQNVKIIELLERRKGEE